MRQSGQEFVVKGARRVAYGPRHGLFAFFVFIFVFHALPEGGSYLSP